MTSIITGMSLRALSAMRSCAAIGGLFIAPGTALRIAAAGAVRCCCIGCRWRTSAAGKAVNAIVTRTSKHCHIICFKVLVVMMIKQVHALYDKHAAWNCSPF